MGCLIGLYEGPITKVIWSGYPGQTADHFFYGFAILELIMLVFFWHPIFSFMIPIIVFELLSLNHLQKNSQHSWLEDSFLFTHPKFSKSIFFIVTFIGAVFLTVNAGFNLTIILLSGLGNFLIVFLLKRNLLKKNLLRGIESIRLSDKWFKIVFFYLIILYLVMFIIINPNLIPNSFTLILTGLIYFFILGLYMINPPKTKTKHFSYIEIDFSKRIGNSWILFLIFLLLFMFIPGIISIVLALIYLILLFFGLLLFFWRFYAVFKNNLGKQGI